MSGSKTIIADDDRLPNVHPGDVLREDFWIGSALPILEVSVGARVDVDHLSDVVNGGRDVDADLDLRLSRYLGMSEGFFLRLQNLFDLEEARRRTGDELDRIVPRAA